MPFKKWNISLDDLLGKEPNKIYKVRETKKSIEQSIAFWGKLREASEEDGYTALLVGKMFMGYEFIELMHEKEKQRLIEYEEKRKLRM